MTRSNTRERSRTSCGGRRSSRGPVPPLPGSCGCPAARTRSVPNRGTNTCLTTSIDPRLGLPPVSCVEASRGGGYRPAGAFVDGVLRDPTGRAIFDASGNFIAGSGCAPCGGPAVAGNGCGGPWAGQRPDLPPCGGRRADVPCKLDAGPGAPLPPAPCGPRLYGSKQCYACPTAAMAARVCLPYAHTGPSVSCVTNNTAVDPNVCVRCPVTVTSRRRLQPCEVCRLSPTARVVASIVLLANSCGSTAYEIAAHQCMLCADGKRLDESCVALVLRNGVQKGIFCHVGEGRFKVDAFFGDKPSNATLIAELGPNYQMFLGMFVGAHCGDPLDPTVVERKAIAVGSAIIYGERCASERTDSDESDDDSDNDSDESDADDDSDAVSVAQKLEPFPRRRAAQFRDADSTAERVRESRRADS